MTTHQSLAPATAASSLPSSDVGLVQPTLNSIAASLEAIASHLGTAPTLGFVQPPKATWIYANRTQGDRWYWRTPTGAYDLCPTSAIAGVLTRLEFKEVTRRQQPVWKLWATLESDRTYIIESGRESVFTKSLLVAITTLTPDQLKRPLTLDVYPADQNEESLFCSVYVEGEKIYQKWGESPDWEHIAQTAMAVVDHAHGSTRPAIAETSGESATAP